MIQNTHDKSISNMNNHLNYSDETDQIDEINPEDRNPDPITGQPGAHPLGTGVGAAGVGTVATVIGATVGGPVGAVVGAVVGSVAGGLAGKSTAESVNPSSEDKQSLKDA
jgi:hypothetical protein